VQGPDASGGAAGGTIGSAGVAFGASTGGLK
jgi:hypothetical protein